MVKYRKVLLFFSLTLFFVFFVVAFLISFVQLSQKYGGKSFHLTYKNNEQHLNIGTRSFKCFGTCFCDDLQRRNGVSSIPRGVSFVVSAVSSLIAYKTAKNHFENKCEEEKEELKCSDNIRYEIDRCEDENLFMESVDGDPFETTGEDGLRKSRKGRSRKEEEEYISENIAIIHVDLEWIFDRNPNEEKNIVQIGAYDCISKKKFVRYKDPNLPRRSYGYRCRYFSEEIKTRLLSGYNVMTDEKRFWFNFLHWLKQFAAHRVYLMAWNGYNCDFKMISYKLKKFGLIQLLPERITCIDSMVLACLMFESGGRSVQKVMDSFPEAFGNRKHRHEALMDCVDESDCCVAMLKGDEQLLTQFCMDYEEYFSDLEFENNVFEGIEYENLCKRVNIKKRREQFKNWLEKKDHYEDVF